MYDESAIDDESEKFKKYLKDFHVLDRFRKKMISQARSYVVMNADPRVAGLAYFSGWKYIDGESPRNEMCYIIIERPL